MFKLFVYLILIFGVIEINAFFVAPKIEANLKSMGSSTPVYVNYYLQFSHTTRFGF